VFLIQLQSGPTQNINKQTKFCASASDFLVICKNYDPLISDSLTWKNVKLNCRVCMKEIYRKDVDYLSPFGQTKITSLFPGATKAKTEEISDQKTETTAVDDMERVVGEEDIESKKRRHESGDSIENGCFEGDSSSN
jgi:hypothetical protein